MSASTRGEDQHRVLEAGVLGVGLDALEGRLGADALDLEVGDEDHQRRPRASTARATGRSVARNQKFVK